MALQLLAVFVNDAADPSDYVALPYAGESYSLATIRGGGVEGGYASGRVRSWSSAEESVQGQFQFHRTTPEQRAWLGEHAGRTVCFRDHLGSKVFGVYHAVQKSLSTLPVDHRAANNSVSIQFQSVTWSEAV